MRSFVIVLATMAAGTGCVGAPVGWNDTVSQARSYKPGVWIEAATGSTMVWWQDTRLPASYTNRFQIAPYRVSEPATAGLQWTAWYTYLGTDCPGGEYVITSHDWYRDAIGFIIDGTGMTTCRAAAIRIPGKFLQFRSKTWDLEVRIQFERVPSAGGIWHELVYTGISKGTIRITHREYTVTVQPYRPGTAPTTESLPREPFYLDLEYDLSRSGQVITFRDIRILVESADPERIVFMVTEP